MLRLRRRSAANTVAPLRITTITSGVSMSAYISEISRPSLCTRRAIFVELRRGLLAPFRSRLGPGVSTGACLVRSSAMQARYYGPSNPDWVPHGLHFHKSCDELRARLVGRHLDHSLDVVGGRDLDGFD